jgi:hypothetical protein
MYTCQIDCDYNSTVSEFLEILTKWENPIILKYIPEGPGGGNPCISLLFSKHETIVNFLKHWHDEEDEDFDEEFILSQISVI